MYNLTSSLDFLGPYFMPGFLWTNFQQTVLEIPPIDTNQKVREVSIDWPGKNEGKRTIKKKREKKRIIKKLYCVCQN